MSAKGTRYSSPFNEVARDAVIDMAQLNASNDPQCEAACWVNPGIAAKNALMSNFALSYRVWTVRSLSFAVFITDSS